ncbi:MAG: hypothetical protein KKC75_02625 [Nanoarchaeota archaeon]|nr:hypothetical protein [Nanoarchaeota archaeon]
MKNKKLLLLIVLAVLVAGSMAVEGANIFSRFSSKLGGVKSLGIMAVNAIIIGAVLYFGLSLIPQINPKEKSGKIVFAVVVIIFAIMFAVHLNKTIEGKFIWSSDSFKAGKDYLFTDEYPDKEGDTVHGILHPKHIWKFMGFGLIITWLFITFLKVGQGKQVVDISLAVILSASAVHSGISLSNVIRMGQIVSLFILTVQFSKIFEGLGKGWGWLLGFTMALVLVWLISYLVFGTGILLWSGVGGDDGVQSPDTPKGTVESKDPKTGATEPVSKMWVLIITLIMLLAAIAAAYFIP